MKKRDPEIVTPSEQEVAAYGGRQNDAESAEAAGSPPAVAEEVQQWKDKFLRAKADFSNYQRRAEKDHADALRYANAGLIRGLLSVIDDLERVLESAPKHCENNTAAILDGVKLTWDNFLKTLKQFGVEPIEAEGRPFDPQLHEALMEQPRSDVPNRTVVQQAMRGYRLFDRVLRPAKVVVAKGTEGGEPATED